MTYLTKLAPEESQKFVGQIASTCMELGGPLTAQLYSLYDQGRILELIDFNIDYSWKFTVSDFLYARQIQGLFAKRDDLDLGIDTESAAYERFLQSEDICREANIRLENHASLDWDVGAVLHRSSGNIAGVLGDVPLVGELNMSFGPGATTSTKSTEANARVKLSASLECSMNLVPELGRLLLEFPMLCEINDVQACENTWTVPINIVPGKLSFVDKNSRTKRSIVVEPNLNSLGQSGIGKHLKQKILIGTGINLKNQTLNQDLARLGSISNEIATVDGVMASDCICRELVWNQLGYEWASFLDSYRSPVVDYFRNGKLVNTFVLEKFSSMGNAYTFELETLIFWGLATACCEHLGLSKSERDLVRVYGDDIIIPSKAYDLLTKVLAVCGIAVNLSKSYADGPFRESCGADFYLGMDIRPFYLKTLIDVRILFIMYNWFTRHTEHKLADVVLPFIPEPLRLWGPDGYGDGHLVGEWSPRTSRKRQRAGFEGGTFDTYTLKPKFFRTKLPGDYVFPVYSIYVEPAESWKLFNSNHEPSCTTDDKNGCVRSDYDAEMNTVRGHGWYSKISIYTLTKSIFGSYKDDCPNADRF